MYRFNCISLAKLLIIIVKKILFICHYVYNHAFYTILCVCLMNLHGSSEISSDTAIMK